MAGNLDSPLPLLVLGALAGGVWWLWSNHESPERRAQRIAREEQRRAEEARAQHERERIRQAVERGRDGILARPIPREIEREMRNFLSKGIFFGEEQSPLTYVGYRVGKTNGLLLDERQQRLRACFQIEIPRELAAKYQGWGRPVTERRYHSIRRHLIMLADTRRRRSNFGQAVTDWETDEAWFRETYTAVAARLRDNGYRH